MIAAVKERLRDFWTAPVTPRRLAWFRIGLGGVLLAQAVSLIGNLEDLFGRHGIVAWSVLEESLPAGVPNLAWLNGAFGFVGLSTAFVVPLVFAIYVCGLSSLLLGYRTRLAAALAWLAHTMLVTSGELATYGVDRFAQIGLFYCMWFPAGDAVSPDRAASRAGLGDSGPTFFARLALRVLQLHVCISYTASGVEKARGEQWWSGEAIWRALMGAPLETPIDCSFLASVPWLAKGLCWMTLLLEAGVIGFVWHPRLRRFWLVGIVGMHLGIALVLGLWTFSATMIVFDIAAFSICSGSRCDKIDSASSPAADVAA